MEGAETTCSFDGSRQTNYVQLLSLADGDGSLTQPAFGNVTYFTTTPAHSQAIVMLNTADPNQPGTSAAVGEFASTSAITQPQLLLAYDLGDGQYAIGGVLMNPDDGGMDMTSSDFPAVQNECDTSNSNAIDQEEEPVESSPVRSSIGPSQSYDTEAQLEAPTIDGHQHPMVLPFIPLPQSRPAPSVVFGRRNDEGELLRGAKRLQPNGVPPTIVHRSPTKGKKGHWPKGKKRKTTHPTLKEPAAPATAYVWYARERRPLLRIEFPEYPNADLTRMIGQEWTLLSKNEKRKYFQKAHDDMGRYKKEMCEYQRSQEYREFTNEQTDRSAAMEPSTSEERREYSGDQSESTAAVDGLYCDDCDLYFFNAHNKSEHMRSRKHQRNTVGAFVNYFTKKTRNAPDEMDEQIGDFPSDSLPDPVDMEDFIAQYMIKNEERTMELVELRHRCNLMTSRHESSTRNLASLESKQEQLKKAIAQSKSEQMSLEKTLGSLQTTSALFDAEFGFFPT